VRRGPATAKLNLALLVGRKGDDGRHEVCTVLQRIDLADRITVEPSVTLRVSGFAQDTLVRTALARLAERAGVEPRWRARIAKRIPVAAGLGGGSSDAATALRLANETLDEPLSQNDLQKLAAELGADVPFFLTAGPQLGEGDGTRLTARELPQDYFETRRDDLLAALDQVRRPADLMRLPPNDLASSPLASELERLGAFRADVTGAGPAVYGLFTRREQAASAQRELRPRGRTWLTVPAWYG
jgi:4-diphosphocytidyl-2-C-methyl-D-erythritol kinase